MAKTTKKKKKQQTKQDARGYGQSSSSSLSVPAAAPVVSVATREGLKELLLLQQATPEDVAITSASIIVYESGRFVSKLTHVVETLESLSFADVHIDRVVAALGLSLTLEGALDWLCLHLTTLDLPALFTDGRALRDHLTNNNNNRHGGVTVLTLETVGSDSVERAESMLPPSIASLSNKRETTESTMQEQLEADERKAWLLQQYAYEEEEEEEEETNETGESAQDTRQTPQHVTERTTLSTVSDKVQDMAIAAPSPEELYLKDLEAEIETLKADVSNEANNYMRSKQETKQLQNELKRKQQQVNGIQKRIERAKAAELKKQAEKDAMASNDISTGIVDIFATGDNNNDDEEYEGGHGLFDAPAEPSNTDDTPTDATPVPQQPATDRLELVIPNDWTGTTPRKVLDEACRKQKLPRPKYAAMHHRRGYSLSVTLQKKDSPRVYEALSVEFAKNSSLQDFLACKALYDLDPTKPVYTLFPPAFRSLWLSWKRKVKHAQNEAEKIKDDLRKIRIDQLLALARSSKLTESMTTPQPGNILKGERDGELPMQDSQKDKSDVNSADSTSRVATLKPTENSRAAGLKLKDCFDRRRSTPGYQKMLRSRMNLPMYAFRETFMTTVANNPVTIVCAETGAGKTTQCGQYLLEQSLLDGCGDSVQILCTQPRRVAATSVAERVSEEMCEPSLGRLVGYQIRMESRRSSETKLLFCTTGVVLRRLQEDRDLQGVTHIIVDEVHERQQQTDVLIVALRRLLTTTRPDLKIILMSATLDANLFCSYFGRAPLVSVPGRTFPVSTYFLEDLLDATDHVIEEGSRFALRGTTSSEKATLWVTGRGGEKRREVAEMEAQTEISEVSDMYPGYKMSTRRSMDRVNEEVINFDLIEDVLSLLLLRPQDSLALLGPDKTDISNGSILVFLPGLGEIRSMSERLESNRLLGDSNKFEIIPMHSALSSKDQRRAFMPSKAGQRKIVLATNIAETSVTIPDVVCIIDSGRVREVRRNKRKNTSVLVTDWCSKASAKQRAGRAGRVQAGICLKLYSSHTAQVTMKAESEPELKRVPLEEVCLSILASGFASNCMDFLSQAPQPPSPDSVLAATKVLDEIGAIEVVEHGMSRRIERLTPLGEHLAKLPVDVRLGKILIYGTIFRCIDRAVTIAAALSSQSVFSTFVQDGNVAKAKQRSFSHPDSDFLTLCHVWESFAEASSRSTSAGRKFCSTNYLNWAALREIADARRQFLGLLLGIGFLDKSVVVLGKSQHDSDTTIRQSLFNQNGSNDDVLHAVICAGLYPNVARLELPSSSSSSSSTEYSLWHQQERLYFHSSSVNAKTKRRAGGWVVYHEKFATPHRVSVSTTCFVHPFALLLLGGTVQVKHRERKVIVDGWMEIGMAAQIGVVMRELGKSVERTLRTMIETPMDSRKCCWWEEEIDNGMIDGIVRLLSSSAE